MKIAQLSPVFECVPPKGYGGTERIVSFLTEELVSRGHEVTLFASGDSVTKAKLVATAPRSTRTDRDIKEPHAYLVAQLELVLAHAAEFDIIHSHVDFFGFPLARRISTPLITTLHGRMDLVEIAKVFGLFPEVKLVSISNNQREPLPNAHWLETVYHGLPTQAYVPGDGSGNYLAFLGRTSPEKGVDTAIEIAKRTGMKLKIAAKVDKNDQEYFDLVIKPMLYDPNVEFLGEIEEKDKNSFLAGASAFIYPIRWPEPFGLAMIEAMACGTPVLAMRDGSVPEIIEDGKTGFICESIDQMVEAVGRIGGIDRRVCREAVEQRFSVSAMAEAYEAVYRKVLAGRR